MEKTDAMRAHRLANRRKHSISHFKPAAQRCTKQDKIIESSTSASSGGEQGFMRSSGTRHVNCADASIKDAWDSSSDEDAIRANAANIDSTLVKERVEAPNLAKHIVRDSWEDAMIVEEAQKACIDIVDQCCVDSIAVETFNGACELHAIEYRQSEMVLFKLNANASELVPTISQFCKRRQHNTDIWWLLRRRMVATSWSNKL